MIRTAIRVAWLRWFHVCSEWDEHGRCVVCLEPTKPAPTLEDEMACYWEDENDER